MKIAKKTSFLRKLEKWKRLEKSLTTFPNWIDFYPIYVFQIQRDSFFVYSFNRRYFMRLAFAEGS